MRIFIGEGGRQVLKKVKAYVAMVMLMLGFAGLNIISAATLRNGIDQNVLVVYRNIAAAVFITPFALWFERKRRPKITPLVLLKIFGLAVLDPLLQQHLYYTGVKWTSASFASEVENMIPAATYFMALLLRMEKLEIKLKRGQAKVIGILVTVAGALVMILYKGPTLEFMQYLKGRRHPHHRNTTASTSHSEDSFMWMKGAFMLIGSITSWAAFLNLQSYTLDTYPPELTISSLVCSMGAVINAVVAFVARRGITKQWILGWDMRLFTVVYSGVICTGVAYYVLGIVSKERGPVFPGAFAPLAMIITIIMGSIFLSEEISLGRTIGAAIIVIGLYSLLWGKSKDYQTRHEAEKNERKSEPVIASSNSIQQVSIDILSPK